MPLIGTPFWIVLLLLTNVFTGLFVYLNINTVDLCRLHLSFDNYEDTNPVYHNFEVESNVKHKRRDVNTESPLLLLRRKKSKELQTQLQSMLKQLGFLLPSVTQPVASVSAECTVASRINECEAAVISAKLDLNTESSLSVCWSPWDTNLTIVDKCPKTEPSKVETSQTEPSRTQKKEETNSPSVFAITPTYTRYTQKVDLTSLCQTVMHVPNLVWIVIEDASKKTSLVSNLLDRCKVTSVHLNVRTPPSYRPRPGADRYKEVYSRGVKQRNLGLSWIRSYCNEVKNCTGAVYFMDDDNKYDLRLFKEIKKIEGVSVFPVAFSGGLKVEGPTCDKNGRAESWHAEWGPERPFPIDMAGFAIHVKDILAKPDVWVGFDESGEPTQRGYLETSFLEKFASRETVECRGDNREVLVWHVKTQKPWVLFEANNPTDDRFEI